MILIILQICSLNCYFNPTRSAEPVSISLRASFFVMNIPSVVLIRRTSWVFIVGPLCGGALAAVVYKGLEKE